MTPMTLTAPPQEPAQAMVAAFSNAVALEISLTRFGITRNVEEDQVQTEADKEMVSATKTILKSEEYLKIRRHDIEFGRWLRRRCLSSLLRKGIYLVPVKILNDVDEAVQDFLAKRGKLIDVFIEAYPQRKTESMGKLHGLANPDDYPSPEEVRGSFSCHVRYLSFGVPENLEGLNANIFEREKARAAKEWSKVLEELKQMLRENMVKLVADVTAKLQPGADGKARTLRTGALNALTEFLTFFEVRNIANDAMLSAVAKKARLLLKGADEKSLNQDLDLRAAVTAGFQSIQAALADQVIVKGKRKISFSEEV